MSEHKLSADDILGELQLNKAKAENRLPSGDMRRVDEIIREILTQKKEAELRQQDRVLTEKERQELQKEIEEQTKTLTLQYDLLQQEKALKKQAAPAEARTEAAPKASPPEQRPAPMREVAPETPLQKAPPRKAPVEAADGSASLPKWANRRRSAFPGMPFPGMEDKTPAEGDRFGEMQRLANTNTQHIRGQMDDINSHFGNFKMGDVRVEDVYLKTEITPSNYKEYKNNRNKKVDGFTLDPAKPAPPPAPETPEPVAEEPLPLSRPKRREKSDFEYHYEYAPGTPAETIAGDLRDLRGSVVRSLSVLGALGINALLLSFIHVGSNGIRLLGGLTISPFLYAAVNLILLGIAMLAASSLFRGMLEGLALGNPTRDLFYAVASVGCLAVNLLFCIRPEALLAPGVVLYTPAAILMLFFNFVARYQSITQISNNFRFLSSDSPKAAVLPVEDARAAKSMVKGVVDAEPVLTRNVPAQFLERFLAHSFRFDLSDAVMQKAAFIALPVAIALAVCGYFVTQSLDIALSLFCGGLVLGGGFLGAVVVALPLRDASGVVTKFAGMMPGYEAVEEYQDVNALLLDGWELFPDKSIILHSIKTFQGKRVDEAILDAASVLVAAKSALQSVFITIINGRTEILRPVDGLQYEDMMGISAWVDDQRVLIGNRALMINHSIAVPRQENEDKYRAEGGEVVYLSAGGELCAAFILDFRADPKTEDIVRLFSRNRIAAVVHSVDCCLSSEMLGRVFGTDPCWFKVLPSRLHPEYAAQTQPRDCADSMLGNNGTLAGALISLAAAKKLHGCIRLGSILFLIGGIVGVGLLACLLFLGKLDTFGCLQAILTAGGFLLLYWLYEKNMHL